MFLGMSDWYYRFVPNVSHVAELLNTLKQKGATFQWTLGCQIVFETLKSLNKAEHNYPLTEKEWLLWLLWRTREQDKKNIQLLCLHLSHYFTCAAFVLSVFFLSNV